jgi:eukaryotic-like serine/threonine-protein kinase
VTSQGPGKRSPRVLPPGTVLENRYEIQRVAGRGGMSTVYAARDLRFGQVERMCAVKEMGDNEPDPGTRALSLVNFERESALLATIAHPAVPKIYDYFADGGMIYLVLEYIDGDDLERALAKRKAPFPEETLLEWTVQICDVLEMLHAYEPAPIIFRDLKPSNIMTRSSGKIALIDFGIARTFQVAQRGTMIGTEGYAPPEQYRGLADARGDIYALGATLHHLATDSDPRQQTPFTFHERPVQSLNPDVSSEFADIVARMLAYHPDQRYQTAKEVRLAIESLQRRSEDPPQIFPATPVTLPRPGIDIDQSSAPIAVAQKRVDRRRPSRKRVMRKQHAVEQVSERVAWTAATGDEVRGTAAFDGESVFIGSYDRHLYCLAPEDGTVRWRFETGRGVVARPALGNGVVLVGSEDSAVYCLQVRDGRERWQHRTSMPVRSSPVIHDDQVFVGSDDGVIYAFNLESGETTWRHRTWGPIRSTPVVGCGKVIIGGDDGYLYALNADTGDVIWRKQSGGAVQSEPVMVNSTVVTSSRSGSVSGFDCDSGSRVWTFQAGAPVISSPRVSADSVIVGVADGALVALNLNDGQVKWIQRYANQITSTPLLGLTTGYIGTVDGSCLAFALETGDLTWKHEVGGRVVSSPCFAGATLVVGSTDGRVYGLSLADWEIQELEAEKASV